MTPCLSVMFAKLARRREFVHEGVHATFAILKDIDRRFQPGAFGEPGDGVVGGERSACQRTSLVSISVI